MIDYVDDLASELFSCPTFIVYLSGPLKVASLGVDDILAELWELEAEYEDDDDGGIMV